MNDMMTWINAHPYIAAILSAAIGWFLRHRGTGSTFLPGFTPAVSEARNPPSIPPGPAWVQPASPPPIVAAGKADHPAIEFLKQSIAAGVATEAMPIVQKMVTPKS